MNETAVLLYPSLEQLIMEIKAVNDAWKVACEVFGEDSPLSTSSRDLKTCLQVRLLQSYAPKQVYLAKDQQGNGEELYGLHLREPIGNWQDANHLPVRIAKQVFTEKELKRFTKK
jgi:hypothetical protein